MPIYTTSTRYSLVKGERIVRFVLIAWLRAFASSKYWFLNFFLQPNAKNITMWEKFVPEVEIYVAFLTFSAKLDTTDVE